MTEPSSSFRRIVVGTDFSPLADVAVRQAVKIAEAFAAELTIVHVQTNLRQAMAALPSEDRWQLMAGDIAKFETALTRKSDERLAKLVAELNSSVAIHTRTLSGSPYIKLIHDVYEHQHDLVVVGTRGHSRLPRWFLGSTALQLVRHCPAPVWVVKSEQPALPTKLLAAVDFSDASARALSAAGAVAEKTRAELFVLHALDESFITTMKDEDLDTAGRVRRKANRAAQKQLKEFVAAHAPTAADAHLKAAWGAPDKRIVAYAKQIKADLLALGSIGQSDIPHLLLGNTAEKVLHAATCDLLTVKAADFTSSVRPALTVT